ncbi:GNAT family N-acetyltransferase [Ulvibacterium marinum]|uniref:Peptidoglycan bridge formation glycyltransferase FemA/FemB family protein n=1 Tax=Ulvibacterium marinum TaxID=2419782 RepID=A0A3B0BU86_9FLAO|nr:GNAT family N-acetyltransferase [Ulvibacterium marinum]RKN76943.1 peptidoglycan bridge formation glycyltransferase FemA/FemB family protein [Ulvibacterium marinum]
MLKIVTEKEEWQKVVYECSNYDFYHTYDYHQISKKKSEVPILIVYKNGASVVAIPFLKKPIDKSQYFDLSSVYGYAGPISNNVDGTFDNSDFIQQFKTAMQELKVVTIFSRLHPFIENQRTIIQGLGDFPTVGKVVNIDLTKTVEEQRAQYRKSTKNRTNKCRKLCTVIKASSQKLMDAFIDIYYESMDRLSADKDYYFPRDYFYRLMASDDFESDLLLVVDNETNTPIAGSIFVKTNNLVQFHLSGSKTSHLNIAPANLFIDEMRLMATEEGYKIFNLGGGLGGKKDSLFEFKASFSKDFRDFEVWKYVVNNEIYHSLSENKQEEIKIKKDFFPAYRV